jgi:hypothetical protein
LPPNIPLRILLSKAYDLYSSCKARGHDPNLHRTKDRIVVYSQRLMIYVLPAKQKTMIQIYTEQKTELLFKYSMNFSVLESRHEVYYLS